MTEPSKITLDIKNLLRRPGSLREIGHFLRDEIKLEWEDHEIVELDFGSETIASGSLFDEIAKLFVEFPKEEVKRRLTFVNIDPWDETLIVHLARLRLNKQKEMERT